MNYLKEMPLENLIKTLANITFLAVIFAFWIVASNLLNTFTGSTQLEPLTAHVGSNEWL